MVSFCLHMTAVSADCRIGSFRRSRIPDDACCFADQALVFSLRLAYTTILDRDFDEK